MPMFDYRCPVCGLETTELVNKAEDTIWCPNCKGFQQAVAMIKIFSQFSAKFIGEGFHVNDYKKKENNGSASQ